jgi:hypothetical protein
VLVLDMIKIISLLGKYTCDTLRILPVKCYIDNSVCLWSCIRNVNNVPFGHQASFVSNDVACLVALEFVHPFQPDGVMPNRKCGQLPGVVDSD